MADTIPAAQLGKAAEQFKKYQDAQGWWHHEDVVPMWDAADKHPGGINRFLRSAHFIDNFLEAAGCDKQDLSASSKNTGLAPKLRNGFKAWKVTVCAADAVARRMGTDCTNSLRFLAQVRSMAAHKYPDLCFHRSWGMALYDFGQGGDLELLEAAIKGMLVAHKMQQPSKADTVKEAAKLKTKLNSLGRDVFIQEINEQHAAQLTTAEEEAGTGGNTSEEDAQPAGANAGNAGPSSLVVEIPASNKRPRVEGYVSPTTMSDEQQAYVKATCQALHIKYFKVFRAASARGHAAYMRVAQVATLHMSNSINAMEAMLALE